MRVHSKSLAKIKAKLMNGYVIELGAFIGSNGRKLEQGLVILNS